MDKVLTSENVPFCSQDWDAEIALPRHVLRLQLTPPPHSEKSKMECSSLEDPLVNSFSLFMLKIFQVQQEAKSSCTMQIQ